MHLQNIQKQAKQQLNRWPKYEKSLTPKIFLHLLGIESSALNTLTLIRPKKRPFFAEAIEHMEKLSCTDDVINDVIKFWRKKVEDRFYYAKGRAVHDLKGEMSPTIYYSIFKGKGKIETKIRKKGSQWQRAFVHSFNPRGE